MKTLNLKDYKFKGENGYYICKGFGLYEENKGFVTFDNKLPYNPAGGRKACLAIINGGGFSEEPNFIQAI